MRWNGRSGAALLLIVLGALILLENAGLGFSRMFEWVIPFVLIGLGYMGVRSGRTVLGWGAVLVGLIVLADKMSGGLGFVVAALLIAGGVYMFRRPKAAAEN